MQTIGTEVKGWPLQEELLAITEAQVANDHLWFYQSLQEPGGDAKGLAGEVSWPLRRPAVCHALGGCYTVNKPQHRG